MPHLCGSTLNYSNSNFNFMFVVANSVQIHTNRMIRILHNLFLNAQQQKGRVMHVLYQPGLKANELNWSVDF